MLAGIYSDAHIYAAKQARAQDGERRVADYLQAGWEIKAAIEGPPRALVLQKGGNALWCVMREYAMPVTLKGVPQLNPGVALRRRGHAIHSAPNFCTENP
jgi:hypothetical protein